MLLFCLGSLLLKDGGFELLGILFISLHGLCLLCLFPVLFILFLNLWFGFFVVPYVLHRQPTISHDVYVFVVFFKGQTRPE